LRSVPTVVMTADGELRPVVRGTGEELRMSDNVWRWGDRSLMMSDVIPRSEKEGTRPPYVCPGCSNHTYSNNIIIRFHVQ
jgi:hypothetical protein